MSFHVTNAQMTSGYFDRLPIDHLLPKWFLDHPEKFIVFLKFSLKARFFVHFTNNYIKHE